MSATQPTVQDLSQYALLAQAAYAYFNGVNLNQEGEIKAALKGENKGDFTQAQADRLIDKDKGGYTVLDHQPNTASGFSATIFQAANGEYIFSLRGTEVDLAGWIHDIVSTDVGDIGMHGIAFKQAIDLFNYYQQVTAKEGDDILQLTLKDPLIDNMPVPAEMDKNKEIKKYQIWKAETIKADKDGVLAGKPFTVVGHSLGGHLAMILGRIAGNQATAVYTFNAPGFDMLPDIGSYNTTELFFQELIQTYSDAGLSNNIDQSFNTSKMHNYAFLGDKGVADIISQVGTIPGGLESVFGDVHNPGSAHGIVKFNDAQPLQAA